jgi:protease IV
MTTLESLMQKKTTIGVIWAIFGDIREPISGHNVAIIEVKGVIYESDKFIKRLQKLTKADDIKAIVVRIESPGGVVAPCQEIYDAILEARKKKKVVTSMGSVGASGGYYIAAAGEKVFALPGTLTGSIGVIMNFTNLEKLYQWAKIGTSTIKSGKFKDIGSTTRPMTEGEREILETTIQDIYGQFRVAVKINRKIDDKVLDEVADGRIFSGHQALEYGLVDELGGLQAAINKGAELALIKGKPKVLYPPEERSSLFKLLTSLSNRLDQASLQIQSALFQGPMYIWGN